jgi:hypothetical protein
VESGREKVVDKFRVESIRTVAKTNHLYVDVAFLDAGRVVHRNDFIMQIPARQREYVGDVGPDGEILDPEAYEETDSDAAGIIAANIRRYVGRAKMETPDARSPRIETEDTDPLGLRARPEVAALVNVEVAV